MRADANEVSLTWSFAGSTYLNGELDNASLLEERRKRLSHLIQVVREMGLLDDISQSVRKQLAEDATVVAIAQDLYHLLPTDTNQYVQGTSGKHSLPISLSA
jgi:hypothetical protein